MHHRILHRLAIAAAPALFAAGTAMAQADDQPVVAADIELPPELNWLADLIEVANLAEVMPALPADAESIEDLPAETRAELDALQLRLQSNSLTNGEVAEQVTDLLQAVDVQQLYDDLPLDSLPGSRPLVEQLGLDGLIAESQQGLNTLGFLVDVITFRFETVSDGVTRQHFGLLNTPMRLNVDRNFGADVVATFSLRPDGDGGLGLTFDVKRTENLIRGLFGVVLGSRPQPPLPLDIRAVVDIPVDALVGGTEPPLRVSFGFNSDTGIPERATLDAAVQNATSGGALNAQANLTTDSPNDDLALVGSVSREQAETREFVELVRFGVDLSPVPASFGLAADLADDLNVSLTSSTPTTPTVTFDAADQASGEIVVDALPTSLDLFLGADDGNQVVQYSAGGPIGAILASLNLEDGLDITASLQDLPDAATLDFGDGSAIDIDLGGAEIGEIAFTLTDGPEPRNVATGNNGAVLDTTEGLVAGARFQGFRGLTFATDPALGLTAMIDTPTPVVFDVDMADGGYADVEFSNFPSEVSLSLADAELLDVSYAANEPVDNLSVLTNLGLDMITAEFENLPTLLELCVAQGAASCTGATGGNVVDASLEADGELTIRDAFFCLAGDCTNPSEFVQLSPLTFTRLALSGNTGESCIDVIFIGEQCLGNGSAGQFFIDTDNAPVAGDIDADLGDTEVYVDGQFQAQNRRLDYSVLEGDFDRSGSMICNPLNIDVITGGTNIGDFGLDPADLLCGN